MLERLKPDVVTMDVNLPRMNGFETTRRIMESIPLPVVIVSASWKADEVATTFRALEAGAVAVLGKPHGPAHPESSVDAARLIQTVKAMSEVKVVRRWTRSRRPAAPSTASDSGFNGDSKAKTAANARTTAPAVRLAAIGASTGGPLVLQTILSSLAKGFPAPVLIVQHITAGFLPGLAQWLSSTTGFPIHIAKRGELALSGCAYLAPDAIHMGIDHNSRIILEASEPEGGLRPAVSYLFRSVSQSFGASAAGVLLTGMGRDGAEELKLMRNAGAVTFAQDQESSVVHGMPGEAIKLDAATYVMNPERIAAFLLGAVEQAHSEPGQRIR
jgi:two-component system chemotaxis response regulator CheB